MTTTKNISNRGRRWWLVGVIALIVFLLLVAWVNAAPILPEFDADNFDRPTDISNPWLKLPVGTKIEYESETDDGTELVKIEITGDTKTIMGVKTLVYRDREYLDGELVEDTRDYLAQDNDGNIWYFGEDVDNYENGKIDNHDGAWLAETDGAKPGYWLIGKPEVGDEYRQEFFPGEAEDVAEVISLKATVKIGLGTYRNCLKTKDTTELEPGHVEYKYYCRQVGALVLEENLEDDERLELTKYTRGQSLHEEERRIRMQKMISLLNQLIIKLRDRLELN